MRRALGLLAVLALLGIVATTLVPPRQPEGLPPERSVLDIHAHVAGLGRGCDACFVAPELRASYKFDWYLRAFGTSAAEMAERGDAVVVLRLREHVQSSRWVRRVVLLALDGVVDRSGELDRAATQVYIPNDYVATLAARHAEFEFGASINPYRHDALELLDEAKRRGAVLVKWIPAIMHVDPADPALDAFYDRLVALGLPLLVHVGDENAFQHAHNVLGDPVRLARPLERGVTVIAAHLATTGENAGEENFTRLLAMFPHFANLHADISSLTQINKLGYLARALARPGLDTRLIHGSDWPLQFFPLVSPWWHLGSAPLAELRYVATLDNPLDRDIALKAAIGVPAAVFTRTLPSAP